MSGNETGAQERNSKRVVPADRGGGRHRNNAYHGPRKHISTDYIYRYDRYSRSYKSYISLSQFAYRLFVITFSSGAFAIGFGIILKRIIGG